MAEGAVRVLNCQVVNTCDANGSCGAGLRNVSFRLDPVSVGSQGEGSYVISYDDVSADMFMQSFEGPIIWSEGRDDVQTLMVSGQTTLLWIHTQGSDPQSLAVEFLDCESPI